MSTHRPMQAACRALFERLHPADSAGKKARKEWMAEIKTTADAAIAKTTAAAQPAATTAPAAQ